MTGHKKVKTSIYFIIPAPPGISPGQRFRFEHYLPFLEDSGIHYKLSSFYSWNSWNILFTPGNTSKKIWIVLKGFGKRFADLFKLWKYDFVFIYREAAPIGPPLIEWIIAKIYRKRIIVDFDDAIWIPASSEYNKLAGYVRWFSKIRLICKWSYKVSVGNDFLAAFAKKYNRNVIVIPTVVDTELVHNKTQVQSTNFPAIGWTGTFSTLKYLDIVLPVLQELQQEFNFTFIVIADKDPHLPLKNYRFIRWQRENEADDLLSMHVGLMPLYDDDLSKGKCGFKAIQYMSLGIPAVVSPVGVNSVIVDDGVNGFICNRNAEWKNCLKKLLTDSSLREKLGSKAKLKIELNYSVVATRQVFLALFYTNQ